VGEIAAIGEKVRGWDVLDRALLLRPPRVPSPHSLTGLADFVHVSAAMEKENLVVKLPQEISAEDATLLPAAALAVRMLREARVPAGGRLLVVGLGLVGQIVILLARHQRVEQLFATDHSPTLKRKAEWSGATRVLPVESVSESVGQELGGTGVHAAVVLRADAPLLQGAFGSLGAQGTLILGSSFAPSARLTVPPAWMQSHEIRVQGVNHFEPGDIREAISTVRQGIVNAETLVSKRIAWGDLAGVSFDEEFWAHGTHVVVEGPE
jgi:L-iditol 2-dehydrogenase